MSRDVEDLDAGSAQVVDPPTVGEHAHVVGTEARRSCILIAVSKNVYPPSGRNDLAPAAMPGRCSGVNTSHMRRVTRTASFPRRLLRVPGISIATSGLRKTVSGRIRTNSDSFYLDQAAQPGKRRGSLLQPTRNPHISLLRHRRKMSMLPLAIEVLGWGEARHKCAGWPCHLIRPGERHRKRMADAA